jgi:hypothetical protein
MPNVDWDQGKKQQKWALYILPQECSYIKIVGMKAKN